MEAIFVMVITLMVLSIFGLVIAKISKINQGVADVMLFVGCIIIVFGLIVGLVVSVC